MAPRSLSSSCLLHETAVSNTVATSDKSSASAVHVYSSNKLQGSFSSSGYEQPPGEAQLQICTSCMNCNDMCYPSIMHAPNQNSQRKERVLPLKMKEAVCAVKAAPSDEPSGCLDSHHMPAKTIAPRHGRERTSRIRLIRLRSLPSCLTDPLRCSIILECCVRDAAVWPLIMATTTARASTVPAIISRCLIVTY